ncbi:MAG: hypothetical protein AB7Q17_12615 [Phycisphaerae bacterium]
MSEWPVLYLHAATAVAAALRAAHESRPADRFEIVRRTLPRRRAAEFARCFAGRTWLSSDAYVSFDFLERLSTAEAVRGGVRELVRLVVLGPAGEGRPAEGKHRDAVYQRLCAEVMREAHDLPRLSQVAVRVEREPDVRRDAVLAGMMRSFLAEHEAKLRYDLNEREQGVEPSRSCGAPVSPAPAASAAAPGPNSTQVRSAYDRLRAEFDERLIQFDEDGARAVLRRIDELFERYPQWLGGARPERFAGDLARMAARRGEFAQETERLAQAAVSAARAGDQARASAALRRLSSIHAARPYLLPAARLQAVRDALIAAGQEEEARRTAHEVVARERAVLDELRQIAAEIHAFHMVAMRLPHDAAEYRAAHERYRAALRAFRSHDNEWLAALILELETLIEDLHDSSGRATAQLDRFLDAVRRGLAATRQELREIEREDPGV